MSRVSFHDFYLLLVLSLVKTASYLPSTLKQAIVNSVAEAAYWFSSEKRRQSEANLKAVMGVTLNTRQRTEIVRQSFLGFWQDVFAWLPSRAERTALAQAEVKGFDCLQQALALGKGVILLEASMFGARGWSKQVLHRQGIDVYQIHAQHHLAGFAYSSDTWVMRKFIKPILDGWERPFVAEIIELPLSDSMSYTRHLLSRLADNQVVCVSGEGHNGQKHIYLSLLGQPRSFATGIVSLAKLSGAPLLPLFCVRESNGKTTLLIEPPLDLGAGTDREARIEYGMMQYVALFERYIHAYPHHYRNWQFLQI